MTIPNDLRVPFIYVDIDPSKAAQGSGVLRYKVLLVGGRVSGGLRPELYVDRVTSYSQALSLYGAGSQLARMFKKFFDGNRTSEVFGCSLNDAGAGAFATGTIVISGSATVDGSLIVYIAGERLAISVASGTAANNVGIALAAAINADIEKPVTAVNIAGTVTLTVKNKGEPGNEIDVRINYNSGEELPSGITCLINGVGVQGLLSGGTTNPDIQDVIDILGDEWFNIICAPYWDATNMTALESEMADRYGPIRMIDGVYLTSRMGTVGTLESWGSGKNSPHVSVIHSQKVPGWSCEVAAAYAAQISKEGQADPARPLQTLELVNILPPAIEDKFTNAENNSLLYDGVSTFYVDNGGKVRIQRAITQYQTNPAGADDVSYLDVETMLTLMFLRYDFRTQILSRYSRAKLADDGVQIGAGQQVMTPKLGKSEAINIFRGWERLGLVENIDQFKRDLICERSSTDVNRLNWILPPDLMNQFRVGAATIQFLLQSPSA